MSHTALHIPFPYAVPAISMIAVAAELSDLRRTRRADRDIAAKAKSYALRMKAQARLARLAELEETSH